MNAESIKKISITFAIALLAFLVLQYSSQLIYESDLMASNTWDPITDWNVVMSEDINSLEMPETESESQQVFGSMSKNIASLNTKYIRLNKTFAKLDGGDVLTMRTEFNPSKISVDGQEIHNDGFGNVMFSTQRYISVPLPESAVDCDIDIYLSTQGAFNVEVDIFKLSENHFMQMQRWLGMLSFVSLISGAVLIALGIFFVLGCIIELKMFSRGMLYGNALLIVLGALLILHGMSVFFADAAFDFFHAETALVMLVALAGGFTAFSVQERWEPLQTLFASFAIIYVMVFFFCRQDHISNLMYNFYPAICGLMLFLGIYTVPKELHDKPYRVAITSCCLLFASTFYSINAMFCFVPVQAIAVVINAVVVMIFYKAEVSQRSIAKREKFAFKTETPSSIDHAVTISAQMFASKSVAEFCCNMALSLKKIVAEDMPNGTGDAITATVAIKENDAYSTIYADDAGDHCNFNVIEKRISQAYNRTIFFGITYVDVYLSQEENVYIICHISGLKRGISDTLRNILKTTYANISNAFENLNLKNEMAEMQEMVFFNLANITEARSQETGQHIRRVSGYTKVVCQAYGMNEEKSNLVAQASMMHDLGKLAISEKIINKTGALTKNERAIMKNHVIWGYNILSGSPGEFMKAAAVIAQQHHEQWDGMGYIGLEKEEIHIYARIVTVADVFDALTSARSYKKSWSLNEAKIFINERSDLQFDRRVVDAFNREFDKIIEVYNQYKDD